MAKSPWRSIPVGVVAALGLSLFPSDWSAAAPKGFQVRSGSASPVIKGSELLIQNGHGAVIDWDSFSIEKGEIVRFMQEGARSCVINRVREGGSRSEILGSLLSNGQVYLINPYGIFIGREAYIETAGFIASTLDLMSGDLEKRFQGDSSAKVENEGAIISKEGFVFLIANDVENRGHVEAPRVGLFAGTDVVIRSDGFDSALMEKNPYALAIRHSGRIRADEVFVAGGDVTLAKDSIIDVSGEHGGGKVFIGKGSRSLVVEKGALVSANALSCGDGGRVIFRSDGFTNYFGHTEIRGDNGGFVEVSGARLGYHGTVDSLSLGKPGEVLLDPTDITISSAMEAGGMFSGFDWESMADTADIDVAELVMLLGMNNVTINTSTETGGPYVGLGTITIDDPIVWSDATTLTLVADRNIVINADITNTGTSMGTFTAMDFSAWGFDDSAVAYHGIDIATGVTVSATEGDIVMYGESSSTAADSCGVRLSGTATLSTTTGSIEISGLGGRAATSYGIQLADDASISATDGTISLAGTGRPMVGVSVNEHIGVVIEDTASVQTSGSGNIFISGSGGSTSGNENHGVELVSSGANRPVIQASGSGNITFQNCIAGNSTSNVAGLYLRDAFISANSGDVRVLGCVGANATSNTSLGVWISSAGGTNTLEISSTSGGVIFDECIGGLNSTISQGLLIDRASTVTIEADSIIFRNCVGSAASGGSIGWNLTSTLTEISGTSVTIEGTAGPSPANNMFGVQMATNPGSMIAVTTGSMNITGTVVGGAGTGLGLRITNTALQGGSGPMNFSGVSYASGESSYGIHFTTTTSGFVFLTTGTVTTFGQGGAGANSIGFRLERDDTAAGLWMVNAYGGSGAGGCHGMLIGGNREFIANSIDITATGGALGTESHGVYVWGRIQKNGNDANPTTVRGYAPSGASDSHGVLVEVRGSPNFNNGRIEAAGASPITITGVSAGGHGVASIATETWHVGTTTGGVTFLNCQGGLYGVSLAGNNFQATNSIVNFVNCSGGTGGVTLSATGTISVPIGIIATNAIVGGSVGFEINATVSLGASGTMTVAATASDTSGTTRGIALTSRGIVGAAGNVSLSGTATAAASSYGIDGVTGAASVTTTSGNITLSGVAQGVGIELAGTTSISSASGAITLSGQGNVGVNLATNNVTSTSGAITVSAVGGSGNGIFFDSWDTGGTSANLTFTHCSSVSDGAALWIQLDHAGSVVFDHCTSATVTALYPGGMTIAGSFIATDTIMGSGIGIQFLGLPVQVGEDILLDASGGSYGIVLITDTQLETTSGAIHLTGRAGSFYGIDVEGGSFITTGSGDITLVGYSSTRAGISLNSIGAGAIGITSTSGNITLSGASIGSTNTAHGVFTGVSTTWDTLTDGTLSFVNCSSTEQDGVRLRCDLTHAGDLVFANATGALRGVYWEGDNSINGSLTAVDPIVGVEGGWLLDGTLSVDGDIAITASALSATNSAHGIYLVAGSLLESSAGSIALNGLSGPSTTASHGVFIDEATVQTVDSALSIMGESRASASDSYGIYQNGTVTTTDGAIEFTGFGGSGSDNYGVHLPSGRALSSVDGSIHIAGYGRSGGANGGHIGVRMTASASIETTGAGNIVISGSGGNTTGANNHGVQLIGADSSDTVLPTVSATGTGNVTFQDCISGNSTGTLIGVGLFLNDATISSNSGTITFERCYGPSSGATNSWGLSLRVPTTNATSTITSTSGAIVFDDCAGKSAATQSVGLTFAEQDGGGTGPRRVEANRILVTNVTGAAAPTSVGMHIGSNSIVTADSGGISIEASAGPATSSGLGYLQDAPSSQLSTTTGGTLSITGMSYGAGGCIGIYCQTANAMLQSDTGEIILSGVSLGGGNNSAGVRLNGALNFTTTGTLTFTNCYGGLGSVGRAIYIVPGPGNRVQTGGAIIATNNISTGSGTGGWAVDVTGGTSGGLRSLTGPIIITAYGVASNAKGFGFSGVLDSTGGGDITLIGIAQASTGTQSWGIEANANGRIQTTGSGNITITGISNSSAAAGISWLNMNTGGTTGVLSFTNCYSAATGIGAAVGVNSIVHSGTVTFTNCVGGRGIQIFGASAISGNLVATDNIVGSYSDGFTVGTMTVTGNVQITATSGATNTNGRGVFFNNTLQVTGATSTITAIGTGGPSSIESSGIRFGDTGVLQTVGGTISLTGFASGTAASHGVLNNAPNSIRSTSGNIVLSGSSVSTNSDAHGVNLDNSWDTITTGTLFFTNCFSASGNAVNSDGNLTHAGNVVFSNCISASDRGVSFGTNTINIGGSLTATNAISGAQRGWINAATMTVTGNVQITASASSSTVAAHGIHLTAGGISALGASTLSLNGTGGPSAAASHGVFFDDGAAVSDSGAISVTGYAQGSAASHGIFLQGASSIRSTDGAITLSGRSDSTGADSHGVLATTATWSTLTSATVTFTNCLGGVTSGYGVQVGNFTTGDDLVFIDCRSRNSGAGVGFVISPVVVGGALIATDQIMGGGASSSGVIVSTDVSVAESAAITALSTSVSGLSAGIYFTAGTFSTTTGSITLVGTGGASSGDGSDGIHMAAGAIQSTDGTITLTGIATGGLGSNRGIAITSIVSATAPITLSGISYASGDGSHGVVSSGALPAATTGDLTFISCRGGVGVGSHGVFLDGELTLEGNLIATDNIVSGSGSSSKGFVAGSISSSNSIQIMAESIAVAGDATGIEVLGTLTTMDDAIALLGRGVSGHGVYFNEGAATTGAGGIDIIGYTMDGVGVQLSATNVLTSTSGTITLSGVSQGSHGVSSEFPWAAITSAPLIFTNCNGTDGNGVNLQASVSTGGIFTATQNIRGDIGFFSSDSVSVVGTNTIEITATGHTSEGISLTGGTMSVVDGTMTLIGFGTDGISLDGAQIASDSGEIFLTGTGSNLGIELLSLDPIISTSGSITVTGVGSASHGVLIGSDWTSGTSGLLTFTSCQGASNSSGVHVPFALDSSTILFTNVTGGTGIYLAGDVTATTSIVATDTIWGNLGILVVGELVSAEVDMEALGTTSHGIFLDQGAISGGTITIGGTSNSATNSAHGLFLSNAAISSMSDPITLTGTGAPSSSASAGVLISGTSNVQTDTSAILVTGSGRGNAANPGVQFSATNALTSTSGAITVTGSSVSSNAGSHGVSVVTHGWDAATTGTVSMSASTGGILSNGVSFEAPFSTGGDVVFTNCEAVNHGSAIYISNTFTVPGDLIATDSIVGSLGPDTRGFTSIGTISVTGTVSITASSTGTTGNCTGVSLTDLSGSTVTISGTGGTSDAPSHGVSLTNGSVFSLGTMTIDGVASGSAISYGININGGGISSMIGTITLTGTSTATGIDSYGVSTLGALNAVTTAPLTFNGSSADSFSIRVGGDLTTGGELVFSDDVAIGIDTATTVTITNDGTMSFDSTIDGAYVGINSLVLDAQSGDVLIAGDVGSINRLASFIIDGANIEFGANVEEIMVGSFEAAAPVVFAHQGTITIDTSSAGGNIQFQDTVDGVASQDQDLVLIAGTGAITFDGSVGSNDALGSLDVQSGSLVTFGANASSVDAGSVTIASPVPTIFSAPLTTVTTTGAIFFGGTVDALTDDGSQSLTLDAGGLITLTDSVGSTGQFGTLLIDNATQLDIGSSASLIRVDTLDVANMVPTILQGTNSALLIEANDVTFSGMVDGDNALGVSLTIDATGSVAFGDAIGASVALGAFSVISATDLTLNSGTLNAASISVASPIPTTLSAVTTNLQAITGEIFFGGDILGASDVDFDAATTVTLLGDVSAGDMSISSATSAIFGPGTHSVNVDSFTINSGIPAILQGNGALTINAAVGDIDFGGTIDGQTNAGGHSLTLNSAADNLFAESIGSNVQLGALNVASGLSAQFLSDVSTINTTSVNVTPAATFAADSTQITSGSVTFDSTVNGTSAGDNSLIITSTGAVSFGDEVGTTARLNAFTIASATSASFGVNSDQIVANSVTTGSSVPVVLQAVTTTIDTSAINGNISLGSTIDGTGALVLDPGLGNILLGGAVDVGSVTIPQATDVTATDITAATLTQVSGVGLSTFNGTITLSGDLSLTGNEFAIQEAVSADDVAIQNTGLLSIGPQGDMTLTGGFSQMGALVETAGDINAVDAISFAAPVTLTGDVSLSSANSDVTFNDTLDGTYDLSVSGDNVYYLAVVGQTDPLNSISTNAGSTIEIHGSQSVFSGPMSYNGPVLLFSNTALSNPGAGAVSFSSSITGPFDFSIDASHTSVTVEGAIDLSDTPDGHRLGISGGTGVILNGAVTTQGLSGTGGMVLIYALNGSIAVTAINSSGALEGGDITITPSRELNGSGLPAGMIVLRGDLDASPVSSLGGIITLSANRAEQPTVATITSSLGGNDVTITGARVTMGIGEAFTVLGSLDLQSVNFTLGDLVALNDLSLAATTIQLNVHGDIPILNNQGQLYISPSLHFLAGDSYTESGTLVPPGPLDAAVVPQLTTDLLTYGTTILNFDQNAFPPPPPPPPFTPEQKAELIYLINVAGAQLSDDLPIYWSNFPPDYLQRRREEKPLKRNKNYTSHTSAILLW